MKAVIIYASVHHGNTKKLVDAISASYEVDVIDAVRIKDKDLSEYDLIGFASGIFFGKFHESVLSFADKNLPEEKKVFLICTYGGKSSYGSIEKILKAKNAEIIDRYGCPGHDSVGPTKLIGGIRKGHPTADEIEGAVEFFGKVIDFLPRRIERIYEDDFGCEGRPEGQEPMITIVLSDGSNVRMKDALAYERDLNEGDHVRVLSDGTLEKEEKNG